MSDLDPQEEVFGGIYRGIVLSNADREAKGRLLVKVPAINGEGPLGWAMPCILAFTTTVASGGDPVHTHGATTRIVIPSVSSPVWVMFEQGSIDFPVWMGTWTGVQA